MGSRGSPSPRTRSVRFAGRWRGKGSRDTWSTGSTPPRPARAIRGPGRRAAHVIIAAGAWSGRIEGVPRPISVEPVRGQMAAFPWPAGAEQAIVQGSGVYVVPRGDEAIVGSTMEAAGFHPESTPAGLAHLFAKASALVPALAHLEVRRTWAGLRPGTPDGLPIIGREPRAEGLWYATGHGREGILLSVVTGRVVAQLVTGEAPMVEDLSAVRPDRFWAW